MATLTNPISPQNIVDRFADYVVATANTGIVWADDAMPFPEFDITKFGGNTSGRPISITGPNIAAAGTSIIASNVYSTLLGQTSAYTRIRQVQAVLILTDTVDSDDILFDQTAISNLNTNYLQTASIAPGSSFGVSTGDLISTTNLENFFNTLQTEFINKRGNVEYIPVTVCHTSCHSNCHNSRARR